jgi:hypothetical protein
MNRNRLMLVGVWCGPIFTALFVLGFILIAHFIPVPSPSRSSAEVAALFRDHKNAIRLGMLIAMISFGFIAGWGAAVAARTRQIEGATPVLAYTQIVCAAVGETIVVLMCVVWEVAAFRPEELAPEVTRMLDDVGWFLMVFDWPPFSVWCAALGLAVLHDKNQRTIFPRWIGYLSIWCALMFIPAGLIAWFKTGPFAWNGIITMYIPVGLFFVWVMIVSVSLMRSLYREKTEEAIQPQPAEADLLHS